MDWRRNGWAITERGTVAPVVTLKSLPIVVLAAAVSLSAGCSREASQGAQWVQVGQHRVRLVPPRGWEHLDHGRQQLFRNGSYAELLLEDLGPATPKALAQEIRETERLWLTGRRRDALARMSTLYGPPLSFLPPEARADFWRPWTDATRRPPMADSASLGRALHELIRGAEALPATPIDKLVEYTLRESHDADRREVSFRGTKQVHDSQWVMIETWDRVSHMYVRRLAFLEDQGYLLYLSTERGTIEQTGGAFDSLLASVELVHKP